ncbi:MAG: MarR family transcriptional regulator [Anaerolineales bacterium]|jgi:DNA-binding MarR family transcriptional regulator
MKNNHPTRLADRLHSTAIHLLRGLRPQDERTGISARRLSALSVIAFAGPISLSNLAEAEQVSLPVTSRMMKDMEYEGLVERIPDPDDRRSARIQITSRGQALFDQARQQRIQAIADKLAALESNQIELLEEVLPILEQITLPPNHPHLTSQSE